MKKIYSLFALITLVLVGFTQVGYAQGKETFETITKENTSYADGEFTGDNNVIWTYTGASFQKKINESMAIILRNRYDDGTLTSSKIPGGCKSISFDYAFPFSESGGASYSIYINETKVGTLDIETYNSEPLKFSVDNINISGDIVIKITADKKLSSNKNRIAIDNIEWTGFTADPSQPIITVTSGLNINFGTIETGTTSEAQTITIEGTKLTEAITATLSDKTNFSCTGDLTNEGGNLSVTYTPSELGEHTATITLSSTGAEDVIINLKGECKKLTAATIEELRTFDADNTTEYSLSGNAIVTLAASDDKNGINDYYLRHAKYIQDATGAILIDDANQTITGNYTAGDQISGLKGTLQSYNGMLQLIPTVDATKGTSGNTVNPIERTLETISVNDQGKLVKLKNVTIQDVDGGNGKIAFGGESGKSGVTYNFAEGTQAVLRIQYPDLAIIGTEIPATAQNITGVVLVYNSDIQIVPISIIDAELDGVKAATTDDNITIYSSNGKIYVNAIGGEKIELFNITGQKVAEKVAVSGINVLDAVYDITLVKVGSKVVKVVK